VFGETAGGVTIAGLKLGLESGAIDPEQSTVAFITGGGLKTVDAVVGKITEPIPVEGTLESFEEAYAAAEGKS
jgi:threonine synthase